MSQSQVGIQRHPSLDMPGRDKPGFKKSTRLDAHSAAYCYVDPDILASCEPAPIGIEADMREILRDHMIDDDGQVRIKLRMHPHLKRWCMYERVKKSGQVYWKVFSIFMEEPNGQLPRDYEALEPTSRKWYAHFAGFIGEFRLPNRTDFQEIKRFDMRFHTTAEVEALLDSREALETAETDASWDDWQQDFLSYYFRQAMQDANQAAGSGWKPWSQATIAVGESEERWTRTWVVTTEKDGYWLKTKKTSEQRREEILTWLREMRPVVEARQATPELAQLKHKRFFEELHLLTLEDLERAMALAKAQL